MTEKTINTTVTSEQFLKEIDSIIENHLHFDKMENAEEGLHYFECKIYPDYREPSAFAENSLKNVLEADNPFEAFEEHFCECTFDASIYYLDEVEKEIRENLTEELSFLLDEVYQDDFQEYLNEHILYYYDTDMFLWETVKVNILVDSGNKNYEYGCDSFSVVNEDGCLDGDSSILWLARQQGKLGTMKKVLKRYYKEKLSFDGIKDRFSATVVQEYDNVYDGCCTLTFCVAMTVKELLNLISEWKKEKSDGNIVLDKDVPCGLFNPFSGGGSVLEIENEKDVVLPIDKIGDIQVENCRYNSLYGYTVDEVYGLVGSFWKEDGLLELNI